jgi:tetratricopeptide (TPR) repeat protein
MSLTDYSLNSRMRRADFLILIEDYAALEVEANKMSELDKVNPRIYRYLGYAAYKNGNLDVAIKALEGFISLPGNKVIALDYLNLGLSRIKKATSADGLSVDTAGYTQGLADIKKGVEMEPLAVQSLSEVGKKMFSQKLYNEAAGVFEFGANIKESTTFLDDNVYYGLAIYYANINKAKEGKADTTALQNADAAFERVLAASPNYLEAYLYRARTNRLLEKDDVMVKNYEDYVAKVTALGDAEQAKPAVKTKFIEAYNNIAASFASSDKTKAIEYFNKTLALDAANSYASESLKILK